MPTSILKLTSGEFLKYINPTGDSNVISFESGPGKMSEADAEELLEDEEKNMLSMIHEHYRQVITGRVLGEILTDPDVGAFAGQDAFQLSFAPMVPSSLVLFKNYASKRKPWVSRTRADAMSSSEYTITEAGELELVTPLAEGDTLVAAYRHDAGEMFTSVRSLVLKAARVELHERIGLFNDDGNVLTESREWILNQVQLWNGDKPKGIGEIDDVNFVPSAETRRDQRKTLKIAFMGGRG